MTPESLAATFSDWIVAALVPLAAWGLSMLRRAAIRDTVIKAVVRGAGAAYMSMIEDKAQGITPASITRAVDDGAAYVEARVPGSLPRVGADTDAVRAMVRAELGKLLAADPGVTVGPSASQSVRTFVASGLFTPPSGGTAVDGVTVGPR